MQKGARVKKAAPKASFAEQERTHLKKGSEKSAKYAKRIPKWSQIRSQTSSKTNAKTAIEKDHELYQESCFSADV